jgi:hypothetical protein
MVKLNKTAESRNQISFYCRAKYKKTYAEFLEIIEKDPRLVPFRFNNSKKMGLSSIAVMNLIYKYVEDWKKDHKSEPIKENKSVESST